MAPPVTKVPPRKVLAPERVSTPPVSWRAPLPLMVPEMFAAAEFSIVRILAPRTMSPEPVMLSTVSLPPRVMRPALVMTASSPIFWLPVVVRLASLSMVTTVAELMVPETIMEPPFTLTVVAPEVLATVVVPSSTVRVPEPVVPLMATTPLVVIAPEPRLTFMTEPSLRA